jgi:hypothetical protein
MEICRLQESISILHTRRDLINYGMEVADGLEESKVCVLQKDDRAFILGPPNTFNDGEGFYKPYARFRQQAEELNINLSYPIGGYHESMERFINAPGQPDRFFSLDPHGESKRAAGDYLVGFTRGYYGEFGRLPGQMAAYISENALTVSGPVYSFYLHDEICEKDPLQYLAQVCVAVSNPPII